MPALRAWDQAVHRSLDTLFSPVADHTSTAPFGHNVARDEIILRAIQTVAGETPPPEI
jgi:hypothetical protein